MMKFIPPDCSSCPSRNNPLLACCPSDELDFIARNKGAQQYRKGETIFREGQLATGLHCVRSGKIKILKSSSEGKEQIVRLAKGGDMLGYHSLLSGNNYSTSAVALDDCVVCCIPRADFFQVWQSNMQFSASLMQLLARALKQAELKMLHLAYKPVRERLAEALLHLYQTYREEDRTDLPFAINIAREDLASLAGTAKETATRLLSEFKEAGIITTRGSQITILKVDLLSRIASLYD